jgi:hypothetical protein
VFAFRGVDYEIDLNEEHLKEIEPYFQVWIERGRGRHPEAGSNRR